MKVNWNIKKKFFSVIICSLVIGCYNLPANASESTDTQVKVENEGTVCVFAREDKLLDVYYLPLNTACASSSRNIWKDKQLNVKVASTDKSLNLAYPDDYSLYINASAVHVKTRNPLETTDCSGSGIQVKTLKVNSIGFIIFFDKYPVGAIAAHKGAISCKTLDKAGKVKPAPYLHDDIKLLNQFAPR